MSNEQKITDSEGARKGVNQDLDGLRPAEAAPLRPVPPGFTRCNENGFHRNSASGDYKCYTLEEALAVGPTPVVKESFTPPALDGIGDGELVGRVISLAELARTAVYTGARQTMESRLIGLESARASLLSRLSTLRAQVAALTGALAVGNAALEKAVSLNREVNDLKVERDALRKALETARKHLLWDSPSGYEAAYHCVVAALAPIQPVEGAQNGNG